MTKDVLLDVGIGEVRLAVMEDGELVELYVEKREGETMLGNIYRGRVERVLPGMQSAFINIGLSKNAFLYVKDLLPEKYDESTDLASGVERPSIKELLAAGQELTVQVVKEMSRQKGPRVTTRITIPGRYLVLLPNRNVAGVSKRMEDSEERKRLKELARSMKPEGAGVIIRTAAEHIPEDMLRKEIESLSEKWELIQRQEAKGAVPRCLYCEPDFVSQTVRERLSPDLNRFIVNDRHVWEQINHFLESASPGLRLRLELFEKNHDLFEYYHVESAIQKALSRKVMLKSGGHIIFDSTEALTVIDVNSGKYVGRASLEETALKINKEAAKMIARQIRLRDISGIIVVDFIDMRDKAHRDEVVTTLKEAVKQDRTLTVVVGMTNLGLMEMTRKKIRQPLASYLTVDCWHCGGTGRRLSPVIVAKKVEKRITRYVAENQTESFEILVHPDIYKVLEGEEKETLGKIEEKYACRLQIFPSHDVAYEEMRMKQTEGQQTVRKLSK